jgi:hypothetical protein
MEKLAKRKDFKNLFGELNNEKISINSKFEEKVKFLEKSNELFFIFEDNDFKNLFFKESK